MHRVRPFLLNGGFIGRGEADALQDVFWKPSFHPAASPGIGYDAYRDIQPFSQGLGKEIGCGTEIGHRGRGTLFPFALGHLQRFESIDSRQGSHTDATFPSIGIGNLFQAAFHGTVVEALHRHLHIALPTGHPYFTYKHMLQGTGVCTIGDGHLFLFKAPFWGVYAK